MRPASLYPLLFVALVILAAIAGAVFLRDTGAADLLDAIPADASLVAQLRDVPASLESLDRVLQAPGSAAEGRAREILTAGLYGAMASHGSHARFSPSALDELLSGEAAVALISGRKRGRTAAALVARPRRVPARGEHAARAIAAEMIPGTADLWTERRHRGRPFALLRFADDAGSLCVGTARGLVMATTSPRALTRLYDALDRRVRSAARDDRFRLARERLPRRAGLYIHVSGDHLRSWLRSIGAQHPSLARAATLAGVESVRHAAFAAQVRGERFHERLFLVLAPEGRGLLLPLLNGPPRAEPRAIPSDPRLAFHAAWSPGKIGPLGDLRGLFVGDDPLIEDLGARLAGLLDFLGVDAREDLLSSLGRDVKISAGNADWLPRSPGPPSGRRIPWSLTVSLRRPQTVRRLLGRVDGLGRVFGSRHSGPGESGITWFEVPILAPMMPSYELDGRTLRLASSPDLLQAPEALPPSAAPAPPESTAGGLPDRAHVYFRVSSGRLSDLVRELAWPREHFEEFSRDPAASPATGAVRLDESGLLLQWVSPVSATSFAAGWLPGDLGAPEEGPAPPPASFSPKDWLY